MHRLIRVSQLHEATVQTAALLSVDPTEVGEEDSFLGQTPGGGPAPSTFNYFSSPVTSGDPFAAIGRPPAPSAATTSTGPPSVPHGVTTAPPPQMSPGPAAFGGAVDQSPVGRHTPPVATMTPPPPQSHNPYRHTPLGSKARPCRPAAEVLPPTHTPQRHPDALGSPPQTFPPPAFSTVDIIR